MRESRAASVGLALFGAFFLLAPALGLAQADHAPPTPSGKLVDIGGRRLNIACSGQGGPTVILIHGAGAFSFDWALVQSQITGNRVCSYDRAGHAWSDPAPVAQTYSQMADDLHQLLTRSGEKSPFLLVGHSAGGDVLRVFAAANAEEVAGGVLVDTGHPDALRIINGKLVRVRVLADLAPAGSPSGFPPVAAPPVPPGGAEPPRIESPYNRLPAKAQAWRLWCQAAGKLPASSAKAEVDSLSQVRAAHARGAELFGDKPLIVVSRAKGGYRPIRGVVSEDQAEQLERERMEHNADLLNLSRNSQAIAADGSGHDVHVERPDLVVKAIEQVSDAVNRQSRLQR